MLCLAMRIIIMERYLHSIPRGRLLKVNPYLHGVMFRVWESYCLLDVINTYFKMFFVYTYRTVFRKVL